MIYYDIGEEHFLSNAGCWTIFTLVIGPDEDRKKFEMAIPGLSVGLNDRLMVLNRFFLKIKDEIWSRALLA